MGNNLKQEIDSIVEQHQVWLRTNGAEGKRGFLSGANLCGFSFEKLNLDKFIFDHANMDGCNLNRASLIGAKMNGVFFRNGSALRTDFTDAELCGVDFTNANVDGSVFEDADMRWSMIGSANLTAIKESFEKHVLTLDAEQRAMLSLLLRAKSLTQNNLTDMNRMMNMMGTKPLFIWWCFGKEEGSIPAELQDIMHEWIRPFNK